jgi:hypothetical protein
MVDGLTVGTSEQELCDRIDSRLRENEPSFERPRTGILEKPAPVLVRSVPRQVTKATRRQVDTRPLPRQIWDSCAAKAGQFAPLSSFTPGADDDDDDGTSKIGEESPLWEAARQGGVKVVLKLAVPSIIPRKRKSGDDFDGSDDSNEDDSQEACLLLIDAWTTVQRAGKPRAESKAQKQKHQTSSRAASRSDQAEDAGSSASAPARAKAAKNIVPSTLEVHIGPNVHRGADLSLSVQSCDYPFKFSMPLPLLFPGGEEDTVVVEFSGSHASGDSDSNELLSLDHLRLRCLHLLADCSSL